MDNRLVERLIEKLDILIRLQAANLSDRFSTAKDKILFLSSAGLSPKVIGDILGISPNSVSVTLSKAKKARKDGKGAALSGEEVEG